jgi:hypothetical protein
LVRAAIFPKWRHTATLVLGTPMNQPLRGSSAWSTRRDPVDLVAALARGPKRRINGRLRIEPNRQTRGRGAQMRGRRIPSKCPCLYGQASRSPQ